MLIENVLGLNVALNVLQHSDGSNANVVLQLLISCPRTRNCFIKFAIKLNTVQQIGDYALRTVTVCTLVWFFSLVFLQHP